jgi:DNA-3-methyladenine glycosylase
MPSSEVPSTSDFFAVPADVLAPRLIGWRVVRVLDSGERLVGRIVETEAYLGTIDRASHARGGHRSARNESMYAAPGIAYVYFTYGAHDMLNVSCLAAGDPHAVLIRALEPLQGLEEMRRRRAGHADHNLCAGPGKLTRAMAITRELDGVDLLDPLGSLRLEPPEVGRASGALVCTARIGIESAGPRWARRRLRWLERGSAFVTPGRLAADSRQKPIKPRPSEGR